MVLGGFTSESCATDVVIMSHITVNIYIYWILNISLVTGTIFEAMTLVFFQIGSVYGHKGSMYVIFMHCFWAYLC